MYICTWVKFLKLVNALVFDKQMWLIPVKNWQFAEQKHQMTDKFYSARTLWSIKKDIYQIKRKLLQSTLHAYNHFIKVGKQKRHFDEEEHAWSSSSRYTLNNAGYIWIIKPKTYYGHMWIQICQNFYFFQHLPKFYGQKFRTCARS